MVKSYVKTGMIRLFDYKSSILPYIYIYGKFSKTPLSQKGSFCVYLIANDFVSILRDPPF